MDDVNRENLARMIAQQKAALAAMEAVMGMDERPQPGSTTTTGGPNPLFAGLRPSLATQPVDRTIGLAPSRWPDDPPELTPEQRVQLGLHPRFPPPIRDAGQHAAGTTIPESAWESTIEIDTEALDRLAEMSKWREMLIRPGMAQAMLYVLMPVVEEITARLDARYDSPMSVLYQLQTWINLTVAQRVALTDLFRWVESQLDSPNSVIPRTILANMAAATSDYDSGL